MSDGLNRFISTPIGKLARSLVTDSAIARLSSRQRKLVWHVAMPKSGSTWITTVIGNGLKSRGWKRTRLVPAYGRRKQEVDPRQLLLKNALNRNVFIVQQHCPYSEYAVDFIRKFNVRIILQIRSIPDCLMSMVDHFNREGVEAPVAFIQPQQWAKLSEDEKLCFAADLIAPWYIRFWAGWSTVLADPTIACQLVVYDDLLQRPLDRFREIARFCDPDVKDAEVEKWVESGKSGSTRKNKGFSGRGRALPYTMKEQLLRYASYYEGTDFGVVGLNPCDGKIQ